MLVSFFNQILRNQKGATAIEYGLIAGLVAVVLIGALSLMGGNLSTMLNNVAAKL